MRFSSVLEHTCFINYKLLKPMLTLLAFSMWDLICVPFSGWRVLYKTFFDRVRKVILSGLEPQRLTDE